MSATKIVRTVLANDPAVAGLVGDRIEYTIAPQGSALPHLVIVGGPEGDEMMLAGPARFPEASVTIIATAETHGEADQLAQAAATAISGASGRLVAGFHVWFAREAAGGAGYVPADRTHRSIVGFSVRYRAA